MYLPVHFNETNLDVLHKFITLNPFGLLITHGDNGLDANHIPFEFDAKIGAHGLLRGHIARANPLWKDVHNGEDVLVVFRGDQAFISPNWYPSKHEFHKQVPTWNYMVAHAHGRITIHDDERYVRGVVARLAHHHEESQPIPWKMTDSSPDFISMMLKAIVGIEIQITHLVGKFKLSQNRENRDILGAGTALKEQGHRELGQAMLNLVSTKEETQEKPT